MDTNRTGNDGQRRGGHRVGGGCNASKMRVEGFFSCVNCAKYAKLN